MATEFEFPTEAKFVVVIDADGENDAYDIENFLLRKNFFPLVDDDPYATWSWAKLRSYYESLKTAAFSKYVLFPEAFLTMEHQLKLFHSLVEFATTDVDSKVAVVTRYSMIVNFLSLQICLGLLDNQSLSVVFLYGASGNYVYSSFNRMGQLEWWPYGLMAEDRQLSIDKLNALSSVPTIAE